MTTCYNCKVVLTFGEPCHNPNCRVSSIYHAKSRGSEEATGELRSDSIGIGLEEDRCSHCGRRSGGGEIHISNRQGGDSLTVVYVPGVGTVSVKGALSIYGQGLAITSYENINVVSHRRG